MWTRNPSKPVGALLAGLGVVVMVLMGADLSCSRSSPVVHVSVDGSDTTASTFDEGPDFTGGQGSYADSDRWTFTDSIHDSRNIEWGIKYDSIRVLDKGYFCLNHDDVWKIPYWVGYYLSDSNLQGTCDVSYGWKSDTALPPEFQAKDDDYKNQDFDRGHLAPAGCFKRSVAARKATYVLSNACPQTAYVNRGRWRVLEEEVREHVYIRGEAWIFTGTLFLDSCGMNGRTPPDTMSQNLIGVPSHLFKAILSMDPDSLYCAYAFVMPNTTGPIEGPSTRYMITVDELEHLTHYDFFYRLADSIEDVIESRTDAAWPDISTWVPL